MWSVPDDVPCALEKDVCSSWGGFCKSPPGLAYCAESPSPYSLSGRSSRHCEGCWSLSCLLWQNCFSIQFSQFLLYISWWSLIRYINVYINKRFNTANKKQHNYIVHLFCKLFKYLKSILLDISTATCSLLITICMEHLPRLFVSSCLRWDSLRRHIAGSCVFIHSANMCLLVGELNPCNSKWLLIGECLSLCLFSILPIPFYPWFPVFRFLFCFCFCSEMFKFLSFVYIL